MDITFGTLVILCAVLIVVFCIVVWLALFWGKKSVWFHATLETIGKARTVLDEFNFSTTSDKEAMRAACGVLKERPVYKTNEDVRKLVEILELGDKFSSAGYEFDWLPEALRRVHLGIRQANNQ